MTKTIFLTLTPDGAPILRCNGCNKIRNLFFGTDKNVRIDILQQAIDDFTHIHEDCHERHYVSQEVPAAKTNPVSQAESSSNQQITKPLAISQLIVGGPGTGKSSISFPGLKAAVCIYHKDIFNIYKPEWVEKCIASIKAQTFQSFSVYELNYGDDEKMLWDGRPPQYRQWKKKFSDHCHAMNFIFDRAFQDCNVIFNVNLDDWYAPQRFEKQLQAINNGYDLVSSDFSIIDSDGKKMMDRIMSRLNIAKEFKNGHNLIAHPVIAMTGNFWDRNRWYRAEDYAKRAEDFEMWKRASANNEKIFIVPEILLFHRLHKNQTGRKK